MTSAKHTEMYLPGEVIDSHFNIGIVVASYIASFMGCLLTVELLHRRATGIGSLKSWIHTFLCAFALGAIGIWCMHFIGNRAIALGNGQADIQLVYSPGYSTLSAFLPVIGLVFAFTVAERPFKTPIGYWSSLASTGVLAGGSIVGMHYVGNLGISNYTLHYQPEFIAASVIIAVGDSLAVLMLFYNWREKWISDWRRRSLCAAVLAGGISAMHFTAATNCVYYFEYYSGHDKIQSRDTQVIAAGLLCATAWVMVLCVYAFTSYRSKKRKQESQKMMLAWLGHAPDRRILVTTEGVLPSKVITDKFNHHTFGEEFNTGHPVFHWLYRVTRNWNTIVDFIPQMLQHVNMQRARGDEDSPPSSSGSSSLYEYSKDTNYTIFFKELFCSAASSLATTLGIPVTDLGVLHETLIETGTIKDDTTSSYIRDLEMAAPTELYGNGKLLILTRRLSNEDVDYFLNAGFRFAHYQQVGRKVAQSLQIPRRSLNAHIDHLRDYVDRLNTQDMGGTFFSLYTLIPNIDYKEGFEIVTKKDRQDQLPCVKISDDYPEEWQNKIFKAMHDMNPNECADLLGRGPGANEDQRDWALTQRKRILELFKEMPANWRTSAKFYGKQVTAHYSRQLDEAAPVTVLYAFVACGNLADMYGDFVGTSGLARVPFKYFAARHQCYAGSPNNEALARDVRKVFGPVLGQANTGTGPPKKISVSLQNLGNRIAAGLRRPSTMRSNSEDRIGSSSSDIHELVISPIRSQQTSISEDTASGTNRCVQTTESIIDTHSRNAYTPEMLEKIRKQEGSEAHVVSNTGPQLTWVDELLRFFSSVTDRQKEQRSQRYAREARLGISSVI